MNDSTVEHFFDELTTDYTEVIEQCFPRYREMLWALMYYLPNDQFTNILELGCGTGNLTQLLCSSFPEAKIQAVDVSSESLEACQTRLADFDLQCTHQDMRSMEIAEESFDLIVSSIAVHHLVAEEKQRLFADCFRWLRPGGFLCIADQCAGASSLLSQRHTSHWKQISHAAGSSEEDWQMWMQHQQSHDHHDTLADQMRWISEAGFDGVDCPWRYLLWTVIQAKKPVC